MLSAQLDIAPTEDLVAMGEVDCCRDSRESARIAVIVAVRAMIAAAVLYCLSHLLGHPLSSAPRPTSSTKTSNQEVDTAKTEEPRLHLDGPTTLTLGKRTFSIVLVRIGDHSFSPGSIEQAFHFLCPNFSHDHATGIRLATCNGTVTIAPDHTATILDALERAAPGSPCIVTAPYTLQCPPGIGLLSPVPPHGQITFTLQHHRHMTDAVAFAPSNK